MLDNPNQPNPGASRAPTTSTQSTQTVAEIKIAERGVSVKGVRLATAMNDAPRALLARVPLLILPAAGHTWRDYQPIFQRFGSERRIFALDWPGFGGSDKPSPTSFAYNAASFADLLSGWMDSLGIARAVLLGNAVGAAAAIHYAVDHPRRVVGLALVAPDGFMSPGLLRTFASRVFGIPAIFRHIEPAVTSLLLGPTTPEVAAITARHRARRSTPAYPAYIQAYAALWRSFNQPEADLTSLAGQVTAPAILLRGALDPVISAADAHRAAQVTGDHGALELILPEAGHLPFLQQPTPFFQAISGLLETAEANASMLS